MATFNAYVTTDSDGVLTADSRVYVLTADDIRECGVPEQTAGGDTFWPRVAVALRAIGWRPARACVRDTSEPGRVWFNAEELP